MIRSRSEPLIQPTIFPRKGGRWMQPDYPFTVTAVPARQKGKVLVKITAPTTFADDITRALDLLYALSQNLQTRFTQAHLMGVSSRIRLEEARRTLRFRNCYYRLRVQGLKHRAAIKAVAENKKVNVFGWETGIIWKYLPTARAAEPLVRELRANATRRITAGRRRRKLKPV